ncbi:hypothetical protein F5887DRAFT_991801 [Amanita rubescens]|nr:hypothetical protein F5887DRAFT_991801 [Amanita rubescens]
MASLFARTWKTLIHSLITLFWTLILYLRSLNFRPGEHFPTTPKPRGEKRRSVIDLEGGESPCDPRLDASPATPVTPTPCFRRARASTLCAYTPPNADSTPRRPAVTSRSSGSSLSSTIRTSGDARSASGDPIVCGITTDRRLSEGSLCSFATAPSAPSVESIPDGITVANARRSIVVLESREIMSAPENKSLSNFIANHRDSRYVNANRIKGVLLKERNPLPFKCLSPMMTLSLGVAPSSDLPATAKVHRRVSTVAVASELQLSGTKSSIYISEQVSGCLERSCSLDQGLSLKQQGPVAPAQSKAKGRVFARRPGTAGLPLREHRSRTKGIPFTNHVTASLLLAPQDKLSVSKNMSPLQSTKMQSGLGTENGIWDVSFVKKVFSVMRADDGEQDGQDARNIFNRESVWDYRKSSAPSVKPVSRRFSRPVKLDGNDIFAAAIKKSRRGTTKIASMATGRIEGLSKAAPNKRTSRSRHKSALFGPSPSPSIQCQLRKEMIKRQRKLRQETMARELNKSGGPSGKARESYDWRTED